MKSHLLTATAITLLTAGLAAAQPVETIIVTSAADSGPGSLRAALATAAVSETPSQILLAAGTPVAIETTLSYEGSASLSIVGTGQMIMTGNNVTLIAVPNGADLTLTGLTLVGPGGFDINNRGDLDGPAGKGLFIGVPIDAIGPIHLNLTDVTVKNVAGHGVHISDCSLADACGGGAGGGGDGSPASLVINATNLTIDGVGYGRFDADGLRADERGPGSITFTAIGSTFHGVGADGVELDEGDAGDITVLVVDSVFSANGNYCDPSVLGAFLPDQAEAAFDDGTTAADAIPGPITDAPDNACIEREVDFYDSGFVAEFAFGLDLDDGIDLDEAGDGSLIATMLGARVAGNLDEGIDFDEEGAGDIHVSFVATSAEENTDDGFKMSESGAGDVTGIIDHSGARANGGKGMVFEEEDAGDVAVTITNVTTANNDDSDDTGVEVVQDDDGVGTLTVVSSDIADGFDVEGVTVQ